MVKKVLIFGKNGQLAQGFSRAFKSHISPDNPTRETTPTKARFEPLFWGHDEIPNLIRDDLFSQIREFSPSIIINTAAYTAVDKAEAENERTAVYELNVQLPSMLALISLDLKVPLMHFSTDYVYSGMGEQPWSETDTNQPVNFYAYTKLEGEVKILDLNTDAYIFRTSWLYSPIGTNFVKTILRLSEEREELTVINDQFGSPTSAFELARTLEQNLDFLINRCGTEKGIYNLAGEGAVSWCDFAREIVTQAKNLGWPLKVRNIIPIATEEYPTAAKRPKNSRLNQEKVRTNLGLRLSPWKVALNEVILELFRNRQVTSSAIRP